MAVNYKTLKNVDIQNIIETFDTVFVKISYQKVLTDVLEKLEDLKYDCSLITDNDVQKWAMSMFYNNDDIVVQITVADKSADIFTYNHLISELSGPYFWSKEKVEQMGNIALVMNY